MHNYQGDLRSKSHKKVGGLFHIYLNITALGYLDNHLKGTFPSQNRLRFATGGLTPTITLKQKEVPDATICRFRSSFKKYLHWYFGPLIFADSLEMSK